MFKQINSKSLEVVQLLCKYWMSVLLLLYLPGFVKTRLTAQNDFAMPALLSPADAARYTLNGLAKGDFEIHYPRRFTLILKLLRCLPYGLYFRLVGRLRQG